MTDEQHRSSKGRLDPLIREAEAIVVGLTEKVLGHGVNSISVGGAPAGGRQQQDKRICVRKKKRGREG